MKNTTYATNNIKIGDLYSLTNSSSKLNSYKRVPSIQLPFQNTINILQPYSRCNRLLGTEDHPITKKVIQEQNLSKVINKQFFVEENTENQHLGTTGVFHSKVRHYSQPKKFDNPDNKSNSNNAYPKQICSLPIINIISQIESNRKNKTTLKGSQLTVKNHFNLEEQNRHINKIKQCNYFTHKKTVQEQINSQKINQTKYSSESQFNNLHQNKDQKINFCQYKDNDNLIQTSRRLSMTKTVKNPHLQIIKIFSIQTSGEKKQNQVDNLKKQPKDIILKKIKKQNMVQSQQTHKYVENQHEKNPRLQKYCRKNIYTENCQEEDEEINYTQRMRKDQAMKFHQYCESSNRSEGTEQFYGCTSKQYPYILYQMKSLKQKIENMNKYLQKREIQRLQDLHKQQLRLKNSKIDSLSEQNNRLKTLNDVSLLISNFENKTHQKSKICTVSIFGLLVMLLLLIMTVGKSIVC